ncbi:MAG: transglycosylase SLT domain-containing protein, partial [Endozoicomonas sp.]
AAYQKDDNGRFQCLKGAALFKLGKVKQAWEEARYLWLTGQSQHEACDSLFANWKDAGGLTQNLAIARFWMVVEAGNTALAKYLNRSITDPSFKASTRLFWRIHNNPAQIESSRLNGRLEHHRIILLHGLKRLISRDYDQAVELWLKLRDSYPFSEEQVSTIDKRLALKAAKNFMGNASEQIARIDPDFHYPDITEWRIRLALKDQNWGEVLALASQLPLSLQKHSRWQYWAGVARLKLSLSDKKQKTPTPLATLSQKRNFYAFLVADLNEQTFQLNHKDDVVNRKALYKLQVQLQGFKRIREWLYHERLTRAQSELNRILPMLSHQQRKLVPHLAQQWNWHHQAIMMAARESIWNDLDLRFPSPQSRLFNKHARLRRLDYPWVIAIARQESAFHPRAKSRAGARGLMQLMPATAKQTAQKHRIPYRKTSELFNPDTNIALGTAHLAWLADNFDNSRIYATAAYNAGSTPVRRWLRDRGHLPLDIWVETIPYDETRNYVQNVLAFRVIYSSLENKPVRMFSRKEAATLTLAENRQPMVVQNSTTTTVR